jgi:hypothetical protein
MEDINKAQNILLKKIYGSTDFAKSSRKKNNIKTREYDVN